MKLNAYEQAIKQYVCTRCIDCGADGQCRSPDPEGCAIYRFLPELIDIAAKIQDQRIEHYLHCVREEICAYCRNRHTDDKCAVSEALNCALDRYLPIVLDALEQVPAERNVR